MFRGIPGFCEIQVDTAEYKTILDGIQQNYTGVICNLTDTQDIIVCHSEFSMSVFRRFPCIHFAIFNANFMTLLSGIDCIVCLPNSQLIVHDLICRTGSDKQTVVQALVCLYNYVFAHGSFSSLNIQNIRIYVPYRGSSTART